MTKVDYLRLMLDYVKEISRTVAILNPACDFRTNVSARSLHLSVEHHGSIWLLANSDQMGSAAALVRLQWEAYLRGLWAYRLASDDELRDFYCSDKEPFKPYSSMLRKLASVCDGSLVESLTAFHEKYWGPLCSYTHGGGLHLGRRGVDDEIGPKYSHVEVVEILTASNLVALFATQAFLDVSGSVDVENGVLDSFRRVCEAAGRMQGNLDQVKD